MMAGHASDPRASFKFCVLLYCLCIFSIMFALLP